MKKQSQNKVKGQPGTEEDKGLVTILITRQRSERTKGEVWRPFDVSLDLQKASGPETSSSLLTNF
jgi:hypothetical protein